MGPNPLLCSCALRILLVLRAGLLCCRWPSFFQPAALLDRIWQWQSESAHMYMKAYKHIEKYYFCRKYTYVYASYISSVYINIVAFEITWLHIIIDIFQCHPTSPTRLGLKKDLFPFARICSNCPRQAFLGTWYSLLAPPSLEGCWRHQNDATRHSYFQCSLLPSSAWLPDRSVHDIRIPRSSASNDESFASSGASSHFSRTMLALESKLLVPCNLLQDE